MPIPHHWAGPCPSRELHAPPSTLPFAWQGLRFLQAVPAMSLLGLSCSWKDCSFPMERPFLSVWPHSWADWEDGVDGVGTIGMGSRRFGRGQRALRWGCRRASGLRCEHSQPSAQAGGCGGVCISPSVPRLKSNKNKSFAQLWKYYGLSKQKRQLAPRPCKRNALFCLSFPRG